MDKQFLSEHFDSFAATNYEMIAGEVRGIILRFHGLDHKVNLTNDMICAPQCAKNGILYLYPYYRPWAWMNQATVAFVDALLDIAIERFRLKKDIPIGIFGSSMGGYSAFIFAEKSTHKVVCADVNCPCCNMEYELYCNKNNILHTYFDSAMDSCEDFSAYVKENSPINRIDRLQRIPYRFAVGMIDSTLAPAQHSLLMIEKMQAAGLDVTEERYPKVGHCNLGPEGFAAEHQWLIDKILEIGG